MNISGIESALTHNTILQNLINLLKHPQIKEEPLCLNYLLKIINNVTTIKFNYMINAVVTGRDKGKEK